MFKQFLVLLLLAGSLMAAMDVNKASKDDLMSISGIGEKKAEAIIKHRKKHGKFKSIDDLKNVKGVPILAVRLTTVNVCRHQCIQS